MPLLLRFRFRFSLGEKSESVGLLIDDAQIPLLFRRIEPQFDLKLFDQPVDLRVDLVQQILRRLELGSGELARILGVGEPLELVLHKQERFRGSLLWGFAVVS